MLETGLKFELNNLGYAEANYFLYLVHFVLAGAIMMFHLQSCNNSVLMCLSHVEHPLWDIGTEFGGCVILCKPHSQASPFFTVCSYSYTWRKKNSEKWGSIHRVCGHEVDIEGKIRLSNGFLASQDEQFQPHICLESQSEWSISHE